MSELQKNLSERYVFLSKRIFAPHKKTEKGGFERSNSVKNFSKNCNFESENSNTPFFS
jgi:hypothetical protein